jgi:hypothetical protein
MAARAQLDAAGLREALVAAAEVLDDHRAALDQLDLGPGDDLGLDQFEVDQPAVRQAGDEDDDRAVDGRGAGTELAELLGAVVAASAGATSLSAIADALVAAPGAVVSGPVGTDLAQVLAGLAEGLRNADRLDASRLAIGLELAAERLTPADDGRHAGCLPAVLAAAADAALAAVDAGADLGDTLIAAADEGLVELESGPTSNPDLVERGVVDATAAGVLLVLDVLASVVTGEALPAAPQEPAAPSRATSGAGQAFVVRCRVEPHEGCGLESADWLESTWHELGRLVEFDGVSRPWRAELVTTMPGAAIEAVFDVGRPRELHVGLADAGA